MSLIKFFQTKCSLKGEEASGTVGGKARKKREDGQRNTYKYHVPLSRFERIDLAMTSLLANQPVASESVLTHT